ncbi:DUF6246 family protein [Serratia ficaria]|uniref:DUF6246 family protein n=1 Tax=Serratia ficaria TaxID=61651 RepID=UPI00077C2F43|nr:DUF6246 family protein [Serratia ficaria]
MTPSTEIGEMLISDSERDYFLSPSFANMSRIGSPSEIVERYTSLHHSEAPLLIERAIEAYGRVPEWLIQHVNTLGGDAVKTAMIVMQACCSEDLTPLIGEWKGWRNCFVRRRGPMDDYRIIILAQSLMGHGIIGMAKVRRLQRHESNAFVSEFRAFDYISAARNHFNMPRAEAEQLTMTEFQLLLNAKYPDQKGFTKEEYDSVADEYMKKKARRLAKAA